MTAKYVVTDEEEKFFQNRQWELENRWRKRILNPQRILDGLQMLIENKRMMGTVDSNHVTLFADWQSFYHSLGINCDLSGVIIPDDPGGFSRVIIMARGITPQSAYDLCDKNFPCWKYTDENLDKIVTSERTTKGSSYAIRIRDRVEADEELKNLSANDLKQQNIPGITLEEREIYELKFFKETGKHLDIANWTLNSGSRCGDGGVPSASWSSGKFKVHWNHPGSAGGFFLSRQAVS